MHDLYSVLWPNVFTQPRLSSVAPAQIAGYLAFQTFPPTGKVLCTMEARAPYPWTCSH